MGGGMPDIGSGLSGFGQQLADTLGGLLGSSDDALPEPSEIEDPDLPDEEPESEPDDELEEDTAEAEEAVDPVADTAEVCEVAPEPPPPVEPPPPTPAPLPPPPPEPLPPPEPMAAAETPCEIAADELPHVGE
jgi:hypothetical protein